MKLQLKTVQHLKKHSMLQLKLQKKLLRIWAFLLKTLQQEKRKLNQLTMRP
jgi:hypothetical protein